MEFSEVDDPNVAKFGFEIWAEMEVAYGHRKLATFILEHWGHSQHMESDDSLSIFCDCGEYLILERRSLKGMEE